jgi:tRNA isopentenyl-2-thiomethyl-A-37 hydroxylase MiaE
MIAAIWAFAKAVPVFIKTWRWTIAGVAAVTTAVTVFNYIDNHGEMTATIDSNKITIESQADHIEALREELAKRDARLLKIREEKLAEATRARVRLAEANILIGDLQAEQARIQAKLEVTRSETLEAIKNDEDMANWVTIPVPAVAWSLLRNAAEGKSNN